MNIVHVVRQFHPALGGIESVVHELASAQVAAGHRVRVITLNRVFNAARGSVVAGARSNRRRGSHSNAFLWLDAVSACSFRDQIHRRSRTSFTFTLSIFSSTISPGQIPAPKKVVVSTHGGFFHTPYAARLKRLYFLTITRIFIGSV